MEPEIRKPSESEEQEAKTWPIWEKEESEFPWEYTDKETCLILEGGVDVTSDNQTFHFSVGDYVIFPQGMKCTWKINKAVKKHYKFG